MRKLMLLSIGVLVMAACSDAEPLPTTLPTSPAASTTTLAARDVDGDTRQFRGDDHDRGRTDHN